MKLVVTYCEGDRYTYSCDCTVPIEYESGEAFLVDLEEHCKKYIKGLRNHLDMFKDTGIYASKLIESGVYYAPTVRTLEEWWEQEVAKC